MKQSKLHHWSRQSGYIWSMIGSAVGFANIIAFSAQCYRNGGGAFLIPFIVSMCVLGLPMLYLEGLIGFQWKKALVSAYGEAAGSWAKILGWLAVLACVTIGGFYTVLTGYSVAYIYFAAAGVFPSDTEAFFQNDFLHLTEGIHMWGGVSWVPFAGTAVVLALTGYVLYRSISEGIERVCSIFLPILVVLILAMTVGAAFLPGAMDGWVRFLKPDFSKILDVRLWRDVFGHLFFSFSLGLGIVVGYSRHTGENINVVQAMRWVAFGDFAISFIAGLVVFGGIGYMSHIQSVPFDTIVSSDSIFQIGFVVFPKLIQLFGPIFSPVVGALFFFCIFIAGITGVFSIVESIVGNLECEFMWSRRASVVLTVCAIGALSLLFCMGNGLHLVDAVVPMVMGTNMLIGGLAQIVVFGRMSPEINRHRIWDQDWQMRLSALFLSTIAPAVLLVILIGNLVVDFQAMDESVLIRWAWLAFALGCGSYFAYRRAPEKEKGVGDVAAAQQVHV